MRRETQVALFCWKEDPEMDVGVTTGYGIGWGTLALINAGLAQGKGRSGLLWFFVSLILGPVATFLILLLDRNTG